jgi:glycosyltransferase involved in cell wall biosynthesis
MANTNVAYRQRQRLHLSVVIPVFRSEACLPALLTELTRALVPMGWAFEVILVNDFSPDHSWQVIESLCEQYPFVVGVDLRRNFGQDSAILTGLRLARGEYVAVMDDDLQHNPKDLPALVHMAERGYDVVFADFNAKQHKLWKRVGSWINGKVAEWVLYKPKGLYLSPYKVIRREVIEEISRFHGPSPYIDGLLLQATWRMVSIPAEHQERFAGHGNYSFWRSAGVAARLLFSFSVRPVRAVTWIGLVTFGMALAAGAFALGYRILYPDEFSEEHFGWACLLIAILLGIGMQLFFLGIIGEYVGRISLRVNEKPQTSVRIVLNRSEEPPRWKSASS